MDIPTLSTAARDDHSSNSNSSEALESQLRTFQKLSIREESDPACLSSYAYFLSNATETDLFFMK